MTKAEKTVYDLYSWNRNDRTDPVACGKTCDR